MFWGFGWAGWCWWKFGSFWKGQRNEENGHRWGRTWLLFQFNVSNCSTTLFGSWHAAKYCPVQLRAECHCGQLVSATSKRRNVGGILSSVAQFVEAQGWESYTDTFTSQVNKVSLYKGDRWTPTLPSFLRECVWFSVDLREVNNFSQPCDLHWH